MFNLQIEFPNLSSHPFISISINPQKNIKKHYSSKFIIQMHPFRIFNSFFQIHHNFIHIFIISALNLQCSHITQNNKTIPIIYPHCWTLSIQWQLLIMCYMINSSKFNRFLIILIWRLPTQILSIIRYIQQFLMWKLSPLRMLNHQILPRQPIKHLINPTLFQIQRYPLNKIFIPNFLLPMDILVGNLQNIQNFLGLSYTLAIRLRK
jgi:hypothetical protein